MPRDQWLYRYHWPMSNIGFDARRRVSTGPRISMLERSIRSVSRYGSIRAATPAPGVVHRYGNALVADRALPLYSDTPISIDRNIECRVLLSNSVSQALNDLAFSCRSLSFQKKDSLASIVKGAAICIVWSPCLSTRVFYNTDVSHT